MCICCEQPEHAWPLDQGLTVVGSGTDDRGFRAAFAFRLRTRAFELVVGGAVPGQHIEPEVGDGVTPD